MKSSPVTRRWRRGRGPLYYRGLTDFYGEATYSDGLYGGGRAGWQVLPFLHRKLLLACGPPVSSLHRSPPPGAGPLCAANPKGRVHLRYARTCWYEALKCYHHPATATTSGSTAVTWDIPGMVYHMDQTASLDWLSDVPPYNMSPQSWRLQRMGSHSGTRMLTWNPSWETCVDPASGHRPLRIPTY